MAIAGALVGLSVSSFAQAAATRSSAAIPVASMQGTQAGQPMGSTEDDDDDDKAAVIFLSIAAGSAAILGIATLFGNNGDVTLDSDEVGGPLDENDSVG